MTLKEAVEKLKEMDPSRRATSAEKACSSHVGHGLTESYCTYVHPGYDSEPCQVFRADNLETCLEMARVAFEGRATKNEE